MQITVEHMIGYLYFARPVAWLTRAVGKFPALPPYLPFCAYGGTIRSCGRKTGNLCGAADLRLLLLSDRDSGCDCLPEFINGKRLDCCCGKILVASFRSRGDYSSDPGFKIPNKARSDWQEKQETSWKEVRQLRKVAGKLPEAADAVTGQVADWRKPCTKIGR